MNNSPEMLRVIGHMMEQRFKFQTSIERKIIAKYPEIEEGWLQTMVRVHLSYN